MIPSSSCKTWRPVRHGANFVRRCYHAPAGSVKRRPCLQLREKACREVRRRKANPRELLIEQEEKACRNRKDRHDYG
jgi:hypothetical protein